MKRDLSPAEIAMLDGLSDAGEFRAKARAFVEAMLTRAETQAWHPKIIYGVRTAKEQLKLYSIGREYRDGRWRQSPGERVVTNAMPGMSAHNFGLAIDVGLLDDKTKRWLADDHAAWGEMERIAKEHGLESGNSWKFRDAGHVELPSWRAAKEQESSRL